MKLPLRVALLFLVSALAAFLLMTRSIIVYDEGILLTGAMRVLSGDVIHRDFYANYGPGQFYALAGLFQVFGQSVLVERWWDIAVRSGIVVCTYLLLAPRTRPAMAWLGTALCALWLWSLGHPSYPVYPALLLSVAALLLLARALETGGTRLAALAGACVAGVTLFRYDVGFFALCGLAAGAIAFLRLDARGDPGAAPRLAPLLKAFLGTTGGLVLALLLLYTALGALPDFLYDVVFFPADNYARTRGLPFPTPAQWWEAGAPFVALAIYLPLVACAAGAYALWAGAKDSESQRRARVLAFLLIPLVAFFYLKGMVRVSLDHVQLALLPSIVLAALAWELTPRRGPRVAVALVCGLNALAAGAALAQRMDAPDLTARQWSRAGLGVFAMEMEYEQPFRAEAVNYLAQHAAKDDRIFVGLMQHDRIFINDVSAYFTTGHLPATKWHHFDPGLQNRAYTQAEIVKELRTRPPEYVWVESTFENIREPNASADSSGVFLLDQYLRFAYAPAAAFGPIVILKLKPGLKKP